YGDRRRLQDQAARRGHGNAASVVEVIGLEAHFIVQFVGYESIALRADVEGRSETIVGRPSNSFLIQFPLDDAARRPSLSRRQWASWCKSRSRRDGAGRCLKGPPKGLSRMGRPRKRKRRTSFHLLRHI